MKAFFSPKHHSLVKICGAIATFTSGKPGLRVLSRDLQLKMRVRIRKKKCISL